MKRRRRQPRGDIVFTVNIPPRGYVMSHKDSVAAVEGSPTAIERYIVKHFVIDLLVHSWYA